MKKSAFIFAIIIFLTSGVFAISTTIGDSYLPAETVISQISGNILEPITPGDVEFKRGHVAVIFDYDLKKIGENYYVWFVTSETPANYTIFIKDIATTASGNVQQVDYEKNFTISGNLSDYWISPGFISTDKDFQIKAHLNKDSDEQIKITTTKETSFTLKPGDNTIKISISDFNETKLFTLGIGKYNVPAYIRVNKTAAPIIGGGTNESGMINESAEMNKSVSLNLTNLTEINTKNLSEEEKSAINKEREKYNCFEYPGNICKSDEECSGNMIVSADSLEGRCCVGIGASCNPKKISEEGSRAWIGYLIAAIVIIGAIFLWIRYRGVKSEKNPVGKKVLALEKKMP